MSISFSYEILLVFIAVLFISFICGVCRTLTEYYRKKSVAEEELRQSQNRITVSHININNATLSRGVNSELNTNGVINSNGAVNPPPPYPENDLPPSYEEAVSNSYQSLESIPQESAASKEIQLTN